MERTDTKESLSGTATLVNPTARPFNAWLNPRVFRKFAIFNLAYTVAVILWGAYVRATGSGAGCGAHWPLCNGEVLPRPERIQTIIEFAHRASSGLNLILVVAAFLFARRIAPAGTWIRRVSGLAVIAIFLEAILGAGLVLLKLVEFDQSAARAISISLHLVNTLFLVSTLTSTVYFANPQKTDRQTVPRYFSREPFFVATLALFVLLAMMGAIAALGDTLFPATSVLHGFSQDLSPGAHFLIRLRVIHPIVAVLWVMLVFAWSKHFETFEGMGTRNSLLGVVLIQFLIGLVNWMLMAPNWMQLVHLLMAEAAFIVLWWSGLEYEARKSRHTA